MFTGIIESLGIIKQIQPNGEGKILHIECDLDLSDSKIGDSIAVNGACLTAVSIDKHGFKVDMAPETVERTTFHLLTKGSRVNIERALKLSDRLDGHMVSGHVDGTGVVSSIAKKSNAVIINIDISPELGSDLIEKGSIAIEGISLTINQCADTSFEVSIIPHTANITTIGLKKVGDRVNLETDMIGKYVKKILRSGNSCNDAVSDSKKDISMELLGKSGFLI